MIAPEPGGGNEVAGRIIAQALTDGLGQQIVVENRGAASGAIAGSMLAKAPPDGYTLLYYGSTIWLLPFLRKDVPFDPLRDFAPISLATVAPFFIYVHPSLPVKTVKELIALAKARPGELNYGSAGSGAATHLSAELFNSMAGVKITRIAYKGSGLASTGLMANEVQLLFGSASLGLQAAKSGRLRVLAVASKEPSPLAPGVPTASASGLPGYEAASMSGMFAPAKTPRVLINRINGEIVRALASDEVKQRFLNAAIEAVGTSPEQFTAILKADMAKWEKVIKTLGIREE
jgi:tripartite-type tricarboxylate transporter receptor subunit TctC